MNLSRENRLLLCCTQTRIPEDKLNKIKDIISRPLNWEEVLKSAHRHYIAPLLYHNLKDIQQNHFIPQEVMDQLRKAYYGNIIRNTYIYEELKRILYAFRDEGVEVIVLKGAALAETVYGNIGLRYMSDIDLLVREQDYDRAYEMLSKLGYTSYAHEGCLEYQHLFNQDDTIKIDLHRDIHPRPYPFSLDIPKMWERSQVISIADVHTQVLSPEDLIVYLCLHFAYVHRFGKEIQSLVDISQVVSFYGKRINWDLIVREAHKGNFAFFIYYPLYLASESMDVQIEKEILDGLKNGSNLGPFEERLLTLAAQKSILLRNDSSSILFKLFLEVLSKEILGFLPNTRSTKNKSQTPIKKLSSLFYSDLRFLKLIFKFCCRLGRNKTRIIYHKLARNRLVRRFFGYT